MDTVYFYCGNNKKRGFGMSKETWEQQIESLVKEIDPQIQVDQNFVYGYADPKLLASLALGGFSVLTMEYYIVVFAEDKLMLLEVSMGGKLTGNYGEIPYTEIDSVKVKRGMLQYVLTIKIKGERRALKLKCNHKILNADRMGMGWQKENLENMANTGWAGLA